MSINLTPAYGDLENVKVLFNEYVSMLGLDLSFQNYADELEGLPGKYDVPYGRLYIASYGGETAGCAALRPFKDDICEMKRLFVRPRFRGLKIGKALVEQIIADAADIGYRHMVLDTIPTLKSAINLYKGLGFREIEPYCFNPVQGASFFQLDLKPLEDLPYNPK